jgi:hypothetical protein
MGQNKKLNKEKQDMPRFFVDERNGCVAIRDRTLKDPDDNGCDADKIDVVKFATGNKTGTGKFITWNVAPRIISEFRIECALLNES